MKTLILSAVMSVISLSCYAAPPDGSVDPEMRTWYQSLKQPETNYLCCSESDCRPTDLRLSPDNPKQWQGFISKATFGTTAPDKWLDIPNERIIKGKENPTGGAVICWYNNQIFCAVLPSLG